ncbi:MAG: DMT family transporter [Thiomonas sp.]
MSSPVRSLRAAALMLLASFIWGTAFVAQTASIGTVGALTYTGLRFLLGAVVVGAWLALRGIAPFTPTAGHAPARLLWRHGAMLGAVVAVSISLQQIGLESTTVANAGFISSLYVILVPFLGLALRHHGPLAPGLWAGSLLAAAGMYLLSVRGDFHVRHGDWLELAGALFISVQILLLARWAPRHEPLQLALVQFLVCGVLALAAGLAVEPISARALVDGLLPIAYGGVLSVGIAYTLQVVAQRDANPAHAAVIFSMEGVFAALAAWVVLGQRLDARAIAGCALVFAGLVLSQLPRRALTRWLLAAWGWRRSRRAAASDPA